MFAGRAAGKNSAIGLHSSMKLYFGAALLVISRLAFATPAVETWSTATATRPSDGWVLVYRFADRLSPELKKSNQPERVTITWRYVGSNGLPATSERKSMDALEDVINGLGPNTATLVIVDTGNNRRQWVYYVESASSFVGAVRNLQSKASAVPLEFETAPDPSWTFHVSFVRSIRR